MEIREDRPTVTGFVGVYDADGGVRGEAAYVFGKLLSTAHCALCDVTHAGVGRKRAWDQMTDRFGVPFALLHRNEESADVNRAISEGDLAIVLARLEDNSLHVALTAEQLETLGGEVGAFEEALHASLTDRAWALTAPEPTGLP